MRGFLRWGGAVFWTLKINFFFFRRYGKFHREQSCRARNFGWKSFYGSARWDRRERSYGLYFECGGVGFPKVGATENFGETKLFGVEFYEEVILLVKAIGGSLAPVLAGFLNPLFFGGAGHFLGNG